MGLSALSLIVPFSVILMVVFTKRVALSLFVGILVSAVLMHSLHLSQLVEYIYHKITSVFYTYEPEKGLHFNLSNLYVFGFLIFLGILSQVILKSGSVQNFVKKAKKYSKNAKTPEFIAFFSGIIIFVDDYFNALTVGQISKSLNDAHNSTRERLAYIIDSTSAPVCLLVPISSWGAYIMGIMNNDSSPLLKDSFSVLVQSLSSNYYAIFALIAVFLTILWQINLPSMRKYQNIGVKDFYSEQEESSSKLAPLSLLPLSILLLIVSISSLLVYTAVILKNTDASFSLFYGGLFSLIVTYLLAYQFLEKGSFFKLMLDGFKSVGSAILVLTLAWAIGPVIRDDAQTGLYLAHISKEFLNNGGGAYMPLIFFLISGFIAFSTGTSWGAFAIMLPIGAGMANESDIILIVSAILSGAVYGDHTSPISDTTILSATGAGCSVQSHFITQFPYATIAMLCSAVSLGVASFMHSRPLAFVIGAALLVGVFYLLKKFYGENLKT
ncbi:NhaC family sodium:proton (Na+:H+) antiporter [Helicobacter pylori]|uniref:Na+/H+ antiporter NhaC family protein n=1 Tax=Helicobacter pylori TaxID=210 RepID=UPI000D3AEA2F|nr:Na+/H+ antiporter NhaC family protein [Helicobacter pylori]PUD14633.1 sodium:proton antiporter [Helicobacter pylori]BBK69955.1 NhaC family sodium:proton (Na+:H+) antiporter [Helicobacter pylori]